MNSWMGDTFWFLLKIRQDKVENVNGASWKKL